MLATTNRSDPQRIQLGINWLQYVQKYFLPVVKKYEVFLVLTLFFPFLNASNPTFFILLAGLYNFSLVFDRNQLKYPNQS